VSDDKVRVVHEHVLDDKVSAGLERMAAIGEKVREIGREAARGFSVLGGLAGAFAIGETVREVGQLYDAVGRVKSVTGESAENSYAMLQTFEKFGVSVEDGERALTRMTIRGQRLETQMMGALGHANELSSTFQRLGINLKRGPIDAVEKLAAAAQKGKLSSEDIIQTFHVMPQQAGAMMSMLKEGPEAIKKSIEEAAKSAAVIDNAALQSWQKMKRARTEFSSAWQDLVGIFVKRIIPTITPVLQAFTHNIEAWAPAAEKFSEILGTGLEFGANHAKMILYYMTATKAVAMATGQSIGGWAKQSGGAFLERLLTRKGAPGIGGSAYSLGAAGLKAGFNYYGAGGLGIGGASAFGGAGAGAGAAAPLAVAGLALAAVVTDVLLPAFVAWKANVDDIKNRLGAVFTDFKVHLAVLQRGVGSFMISWGPIAWVVKKVGSYFLEMLYDALGAMSAILEFVMHIGAYVKRIVDNPKMFFAASTWDAAGADVDRALLAEWSRRAVDPTSNKDGLPGKGDMIFNNPTFNIEQKFAEGYDPDRIALAFTNEIAELGERARQSGLAPLYTPR
jgi:hypothetical protein